MSPPLLSLAGITKAFAGVPALKGVDFTLLPGEVHALAGENGAGKSTFIKVISGAYSPDSGEIAIGRDSYPSLSPKLARELGIAVVYQEFNLLSELSVAENMFVGGLQGNHFGGYSPKKTEAEARAILERLGSTLDPSRLIGELTVAEQQLVEIGKALVLDASVIIMDEPSTVLAQNELHVLHDVVDRLRNEGRGVIYISHRLDEVLKLADRVTVFKDGAKVITAESSELTHDSLIKNMIGRDLGEFFPTHHYSEGAEVLRCESVTVPKKIFDVSMHLNSGEIVGVAGLGGSGKTTLSRVLVGLEQVAAGTVSLFGSPAPKTPRRCAEAGLVMVPENRKSHGIFAGHSVAFNLTIAMLKRLTRILLLSGPKERDFVSTSINRLDIRPKLPKLDIASLSGGNQQKVVLARWFSSDPKVVVLDEPTRGVDVGAKAEIYAHIEQLRVGGAAVLLASSDVTELLGMCDRILVFHEGRIIDEIDRSDATEEVVIRAATGESNRS